MIYFSGSCTVCVCNGPILPDCTNLNLRLWNVIFKPVQSSDCHIDVATDSNSD